MEFMRPGLVQADVRRLLQAANPRAASEEIESIPTIEPPEWCACLRASPLHPATLNPKALNPKP